MTERMLTDELLEKIILEYKYEMKKTGFEIEEKEYEKARQVLNVALDDGGKACLMKAEAVHSANNRYALLFGFERGLYVGFMQYFVRETEKFPFHKYVQKEILNDFVPGCPVGFQSELYTVSEILEEAESRLTEKEKEHLTSIQIVWEEHRHAILQYSFYLAYRYALSTIEKVKGIGATADIIDKILTTEYELAFTFTKAERECCMDE